MIAGIDIGYGCAKAFLKIDGRIKKIDFPRVLAEAPPNEWKELNTMDIYSMEGQRYVIGRSALHLSNYILRRESRDYVLDNTYWLCLGKILFDSGCFAGNGNTPIRLKHIILGIAPGHYQKETVKKMKTRIRSGIEMFVNNREIRFSAEKASILPQGAGAFFNWALSTDGSVTTSEDLKQLYGVLDVGYRTTDYVLFDEMDFIFDNDLSEDTGVRMILSSMLKMISNRYDYRCNKVEYLEPLLRGDRFFYRGDKIDLSADVTEIVHNHFKNRIEPNLRKRWENRLDRIRKIIVCGGGAHLMKTVPDFLEKYKSLFIVDAEPEYSNARGFFKYAVMNERNNVN